MKKSRRTFIKESALAGTALALTPHTIFAQGSPNEKIIMGIMGVRSRGLALAKEFAKLPMFEVAYICDVDQRYMDKCIAEVAEIQGKKPKGEKDIRKMLEHQDMDGLAIAAPDHWHTPAALMGLQAGKHIYVEKPCSHNPREGEILVEAQKKYNRVVQMGNQRRSWKVVRDAIADLHSGIIGRIYFAKGWYSNNRQSIGFGKVTAVPDYLDYDLWQGPAPRTPYRDNIHPYEWHWFKRWGTGEALNNGTHEIDVMRWGMGLDYPTRVIASGGRYHFNDDWEFPDTLVVNYEFEGGKNISWECRSCNNNPLMGDGRGTAFYGEKGTLIQTKDGYIVYANDREKTVIKEVLPSSSAANSTNTVSPFEELEAVHLINFLEGIKEGKTLNSPIHEGHKSVLMCQLANISWETGRILNIDQRNGRIVGDKEAMKHWGREYEPGWEVRV